MPETGVLALSSDDLELVGPEVELVGRDMDGETKATPELHLGPCE